MNIIAAFEVCAMVCVLVIIVLAKPVWTEYPPAFFIFGDSLADVGNNDYLPLSVMRADYLPYGIDYPRRDPTGRFSNGRIVLDIVADHLGFPIPSPYLSPETKEAAILQGVNCASAGCGILNETSKDPEGCLSLSTQLKYHEKTLLSIVEQLGIENAQKFLSSSVYFVVSGSNDFIGNYLQSNSPDSKRYSPSDFNELLVSSLSRELTRLYHQSARKIVVFGLAPLGCIPSQRAKTIKGVCNEKANRWVVELNHSLRSLVLELDSTLPEAKVTFANPYTLVTKFIRNPSTYGLKNTKEACCGGGHMHSQIPCLPLSTYCNNRSSYLFWDIWHPTEATNVLLSNNLLSSSSALVSPWSIKQLARITR